MRKYFLALLAFIFIVFVSPSVLLAEEKAADIKKSKLSIPKNWEFNVEAKRFIASHTSYEFGSPEAPFTKPISRLEFPVNTWWLNLDLRRTLPRWSIGGRAGLSLNRNSNNWMEDTDWGTSGDINYMTNYSRSYCDVRNAFLFRGDVDVNISDWLRLPPEWEVRPTFAFQFQRFSLMAHDGSQYNYDPMTTEGLDGDAIAFRQDWYTYMIGLKGAYSRNLNKNVEIKLKGEAAWGPALGFNRDHHILRGDRFTYEKTFGTSLYFSTGMDMTVSKTVTMGVGIDYLGIRTSGIHRWWDPAVGGDSAWSDGVYVWSDQLGLTAHIAYLF